MSNPQSVFISKHSESVYWMNNPVMEATLRTILTQSGIQRNEFLGAYKA